MNATRHELGTTHENLIALEMLIQKADTDVRLFATHKDESMGGFDPSLSGPAVNLPLVAALVYDGRRWIVFDGNFLNASRSPRASEVKHLIDQAVAGGKVLYGSSAVDFTAGKSVEKAARYLSDIPTRPLNAESRSDFERMCGMSGGV